MKRVITGAIAAVLFNFGCGQLSTAAPQSMDAEALAAMLAKHYQPFVRPLPGTTWRHTPNVLTGCAMRLSFPGRVTVYCSGGISQIYGYQKDS